MEADRLRLNIEKEEEQARIAQIQELRSLEADQEAEIARKHEAALKEREKHTALIEASKEAEREATQTQQRKKTRLQTARPQSERKRKRTLMQSLKLQRRKSWIFWPRPKAVVLLLRRIMCFPQGWWT